MIESPAPTPPLRGEELSDLQRMLRSGNAANDEPHEEATTLHRETNADSTMLEPLMGRYGDEADFLLPDFRAGVSACNRPNGIEQFGFERLAQTSALRPSEHIRSFGTRKNKKAKKGKVPSLGRRQINGLL